MEAILDTNFIIACIKNKIDFVPALEEQGFKVLLPREVVQELKDLRLNVGHDDRVAIDLALELFSRKKIKKTGLGKGSVDNGLIALGKQGAYIATLDNGIKRVVTNTIGIHTATQSLLIQRA